MAQSRLQKEALKGIIITGNSHPDHKLWIDRNYFRAVYNPLNIQVGVTFFSSSEITAEQAAGPIALIACLGVLVSFPFVLSGSLVLEIRQPAWPWQLHILWICERKTRERKMSTKSTNTGHPSNPPSPFESAGGPAGTNIKHAWSLPNTSSFRPSHFLALRVANAKITMVFKISPNGSLFFFHGFLLRALCLVNTLFNELLPGNVNKRFYWAWLRVEMFLVLKAFIVN